MHITTTLFLSFVLGVSLTGCGGAGGEPPSPTGPGSNQVAPQAEPTFTRTIVTKVNGKWVSAASQITRAEQVAEQEGFDARAKARAAGIIDDTLTRDEVGSCISSDIMIYDGTSYTGDEACFHDSSGTGDDYADLATQERYRVGVFVYYWFESGTNYVASFKNQSQKGCFSNGTGYQYASTSDFYGLYVNDYSTNTASSITSFEYLVLGQYECEFI